MPLQNAAVSFKFCSARSANFVQARLASIPLPPSADCNTAGRRYDGKTS